MSLEASNTPAVPAPPAAAQSVRRPWLFETCFFLGLFFGVLAAVPARLFQDPGTFWHTRIGLTILESGELPERDTLTFTRRAEPWICQYWLCDIGMGALYRLGGWDALLVVTTLLLSATFAWLAGRIYVAGLDGVMVVFIAFLALAASVPQFHVRPLIFTIAFMALEVVLLADVEAGRRRLAELWWFVPMFIVWVNVHGGVIGGLASLALVAGGWLVWGALKLDSPIRTARDAGHLTILSAVCGVTVLVNPYGIKLPLLWFEILRLPLSEFILEHAPLWKNQMMALASIALLVTYLGFLFTTHPKKVRVTWLLPLVWFLLACQRNRHGAIFAVAALATIPDLLPHCALGRLLKWRELYYPDAIGAGTSPPVWRRWALFGLLLALSLLLSASGTPAPLLGAGWARLDRSYWPVDLLPELRKIEKDSSARIFNDDLYGGFLIFHTPDLPVFIDDRCELFGERFLRSYMEMALADPAKFDAAVYDHHLTHALVKRGTPIEQYLRKEKIWTLVGETPSAAPFVRKQGPAKSSGAGQPG